MNADPARALALLEAALQQPPAERSAFLDRECRGDRALRARLDALLRADAKAQGFLEPPPPALPPERVGPYRLLRELGAGGMGRVFLAERADALYQKQVAIKFLRLDHGDLRSRFANERRILATLDHPAIARLLDAGYDPRGQPYVVMDYIEGTTLTRHAEEARLSVAARLDLFLTVLDAVGYAHAHLVVHRDLKPENILVGADGMPRLLDFGIAKLLDAPEAADTRTGSYALTPEYASPEQVRGDPISVASDIYSLGVLLYHLLTGTRPYDFPARSPVAIERVVCDAEPPRPSHVARSRGGPPLERDLDHIVLKAMAKDPAQRYRSCQEFGDDLRRFLEGRPVLARATPPSEVALKFVRRHRVAVSAAAAGIMTLLAVAGLALWQAGEARQQAALARIERDRAEHIRAFLTEMLAAADPAVGGRELTVVDLLDAAAQRLAAESDRDPVLIGAVHLTLAQSYRALGRLDAALDHAETAYGGTPADPSEARALAALVLGQVQLERGETEAADGHLREAAAWYESQSEHRAERATVDQLRGQLRSRAGQYEAAEAHLTRAIATLRGGRPALDAQLAEAIDSLAVTRGRAGRLADAEALHREALDLLRATRGPEHPHTARSWFNLASVLEMQDRFDAAEAAFREVERIQRHHYGERHPDLAQTLASHAFMLNRAGRHEEAAEYGRAAVAAAANLTPPHPIAAYAQAVLGESLLLSGAATAALDHLRNALAQRERLLPPEHPIRLNSLSLLGAALAAIGHCAEGQARMQEAVEQLQASVGAEHEFTRRALARLERHGQSLEPPNGSSTSPPCRTPAPR